MLSRLKKKFIIHCISISVMTAGWLIAVINVGLDRFTSKSILTKGSLTGLCIIIIGSYIQKLSPHIKDTNKEERKP